MKMKYHDYDNILTDLDFLVPSDKVNIFINLETVLKYISMAQDLEKKLITCLDIDTILVSNILNLAAHYKEFFRGNGLDTNVFIYMTDLSSTSYDFRQSQYNEDYRSYYINKYMGNPKFVLLGTKLNEKVIPEVKEICDYIPQVYFISKKGIDSGLIPALIAQEFPERKNIILSGDLYDTQYEYEDKFLAQFYLRGYNTNICASNKSQYLKMITKNDELPNEIIDMFGNESFYKLLLSCMGEKYRSIEGIYGIKFAKLLSYINSGLTNSKITKNTSSASLLSDIFPDEYKKDVFDNMMITDIHSQIKMLGEGEKKSVKTQIADRVDVTSLMKLNDTVFQKYPLRLESLLK
jgi:hypothetical protein